MSTDLAAELRALRKAGYTIRKTRRGSHWRVYDPAGRLVATAGSTPQRGAAAQLRRYVRKGSTK